MFFFKIFNFSSSNPWNFKLYQPNLTLTANVKQEKQRIFLQECFKMVYSFRLDQNNNSLSGVTWFTRMFMKIFASYLCLGLAWLGLCSFTESVAEAAANNFQVTATSSSGSLPSLGLDRPVVYKEKTAKLAHEVWQLGFTLQLTWTGLSSWISTLWAQWLLNVVRRTSTTTANRVGLVTALSKAWGTFCLSSKHESKQNFISKCFT